MLNVTVPVGVGLPAPPLTTTVTVRGCAVVMLVADGVTVSVGVVSGGASINTDTSFEVPPPGAGVVTCTPSFLLVAISEASTWAVSDVLVTYVVVRAFPLISTVEAFVKPTPVSCKVKAGPPATTDEGKTDDRIGIGAPLLAATKLLVTITI